MKNVSPGVWDSFLDLLYPEGINCYLCGDKIHGPHIYGICRACLDNFIFIDEKSCNLCGKYLHSGDLCSDCHNFWHPFERAYSLCVYDGKVKEWVYSFKYAGRSYLARPFGRMMAGRIREIGLLDRIDCIIPVPLYSKKLRQRGYNQSGLLAHVIKRELNLKSGPYMLKREKDTPPLSGLSRQQRLRTMEGAFKVIRKGNITDIKNVLLIDDIYTTGSTVNQCTRALKAAGAAKVYVFTLASGAQW